MTSTERIVDAVMDRMYPVYRTPEQLLGAIKAAEETLYAHGVLVDLLRAEMDNARKEQREARDRVMDLRKQLIAMEKEVR